MNEIKVTEPRGSVTLFGTVKKQSQIFYVSNVKY